MSRSSAVVLLVKAVNLALFDSSSTRKTIFPVNPSANIEPATVRAGHMIPFRSLHCCFEASIFDAGSGGILPAANIPSEYSRVGTKLEGTCLLPRDVRLST